MASANTITGLINPIMEGLDTVSRELTGLIPSVRIDAQAATAAKDQTVRVPIVPQGSLTSITPAAYAPDSGGQTVTYTDVTIDSSYMYPVMFSGEEQKALGNSGNYGDIRAKTFAQAFRTIANAVELAGCGKYKYASRAIGTAGTNPFASTVDNAFLVGKILDDNGAPRGDRSIVCDTTAGAYLKKQFMKVNEAGSDVTARRGIILDINGFAIRESAQVVQHTIGSGAATYETNAAYAAGIKDIVVKTGSGTIVTGDVVTFESEAVANQYVVKTGITAAGQTLTLQNPGLLNNVAITKDLTLAAAYRANMAFDRNAIVLVARPPARPTEGDMAEDVMLVTDPITGLTFEIAMYKQYRQVHYEVSLAWGWAVVKPEHLALVLG